MGYIYKYINNENIIEYIGKTTRPIKDRIIEHKSLDLKDFNGTIYYAEIANDYELDIIEQLLIQQEQPLRNKKMYETCRYPFKIDESAINWQLYYDKSVFIPIKGTCYFDLRNILYNKKMKQNQLSEITGIRPSTISDMCNGLSKSISLKNIYKICKSLECNVDDLIKIE